MKQYSGPNFLVNVPDGWSDESTYVLADPKGEQFRATFVVNSQPVQPDFSLGQYVTQQQELLQSHLGNVSIVEPAKKTKLNGHKARQMIFTSSGPDGRMLRQMQIYVKLGQRVYSLTFTQLEEKFDFDLPTFAAILDSFRFQSKER